MKPGIFANLVCSVLFVVLLFDVVARSQSVDVMRAHFALGVVFKMEELRDLALKERHNAERNLAAAEKTIADSERLIAEARAAGDERAAAYAEAAAERARFARAGAERNRDIATGLLAQIESAKVAAQRSLTEVLSDSEKPNISIFSRISGSVFVVRDGAENSATTEQPLLRSGDGVRTGPDGRARLQLLSGRGTMDVSGDTTVQVDAEPGGLEIFELERGSLRVIVEPAENFAESLRTVIEKYRRDVLTIRDAFKEKAIKDYVRFEKRLKMRTVSVVLADRGTRFIVRQRGDQTEIIVTEGAVEVEPRTGGRKLVVGAGYRIVATPDRMGEPEPLPPEATK